MPPVDGAGNATLLADSVAQTANQLASTSCGLRFLV